MENQKNKNLTLVLMILGVLGIIVAVIFGLSGKNLDLGSSESSSEDVIEYGKLLRAEGESSISLISKKLEQEAIDKETAKLYYMYAIWGDEKLPEEFKSDKLSSDANHIALEIASEFDTYSKETQEKLAPFLKRPEEEGSYLNLKYQGRDEETGMIIPKAHATRPSGTIYTEFFVSADNKVKIWYPNTSTTTNNIYGTGQLPVSAAVAKEMAKKTKKFLDDSKMVKQFRDLLSKSLMSDGTKGGDGKLDIYIAPAGNDLAITWGEHSTPTPSYILINTAIGTSRDRILKTTIAHEVFHSFQYVYGYDTTKDNWWGEATSVWAEDYIYAKADTEHERLDNFIHFPHITLYQESPPSEHHYAAYIFSYFLTETMGTDLMRKIWEGCGVGKCIDAIDDHIDGGLEEQWKKFNLWNYNKAPAKHYTDEGGFPPDISSGDSETLKENQIENKETEVIISNLKALSAEIHENYNEIKDEEYKRITFEDLDKFTNKSENAGIKAIIYLKNGDSSVEDWTGLDKRSFCLEYDEENIKKVVLFFSNSKKKQDITETKLKIKATESCYRINQEDDTDASVRFPYVDGGAYKNVDIDTDIYIKSEGEMLEPPSDKEEYGYLSTWRLNHEFEQEKHAFQISCDGSSVEYGRGWITRSAGFLDFNLSGLNEGDSFSMDLSYGLPHPNGNYEVIPEVFVNCAGISFSATKIDLTGYTGTVKGIYQATIYDMSHDGAKIRVDNACLYNSCTMQDGSPFQTMPEPIILEISKD